MEIPCKICLTHAICRGRIKKSLETNTVNNLLNDTDILTLAVEDLLTFCPIFEQYFPYFPSHHGGVSFPDNCGISEHDWFDRADQIREFMLK